MNKRLLEILNYKTDGSKIAFAEMMGWSPQYLSRLLQGQSAIGMNPTLTLVNKLPELNVRWFLTGEGNMLNIDTAEYLQTLLSLEKYLPFMTPEETEQFASGHPLFSLEQINSWDKQLQAHNARIAAVFAKAYERQNINNSASCSTQTAN